VALGPGESRFDRALASAPVLFRHSGQSARAD
jgi:hypothetical protein